MRTHRIHAAVWFVVGAGGLLFAGCSGDSHEPSSGNNTGQTSNDEQSPLAAYTGHTVSPGFGTVTRVARGSAFGPGSETDSEDERQKFRQVEERVAECMRDEGFEYVPESLEDLEASAADINEAFALEPEEFARTYGYGATTLMGGGNEEDESADPNQEIRDGLSDTAKDAYDQALWGELALMLDAEGTGDVVTEPR